MLESTEKINQKYFELPIASEQMIIFRERAYCYELYHQMRKLLSDDFPYTLSGEVNKAGHPLIASLCGSIIPDFLIHNPGHMGEDDNLVIVEVKTIQGAGYNREGRDLLKDMDSINCMTGLENGYYKGIILIFGADYNDRKEEIKKVYLERCNPNNVALLFHNTAMEKAVKYEKVEEA